MHRSTDRILTSHVGSLPRPDELRALFAAGVATGELERGLRSAVAGVVQQQREAGIDLVNDGEFGKPMTDEVDFGAWGTYVYDRITGYEVQEIEVQPGAEVPISGKDHHDFAAFYATAEGMPATAGSKLKIGINVGPIAYVGYDQVTRDVENLRSALDGRDPSDAFITSLSAGHAEWTPGVPAADREQEAIAAAEAMREEYKVITDAGLCVQVDDPYLVNVYEFDYSLSGDLKGYRAWAERHVELINHSLQGIPQEQVRYHVCWGSWKGPHSSDLPIKHVIDLITKVNAGLYSVEAGNAQHEHEWKAWKDVKLPDGRVVMPGVVSHKTIVLEHPELVADRILRYAEAVGRENVIAGTDCGMGGRLHPQLAWAKLKALTEGAELASRRLWG